MNYELIPKELRPIAEKVEARQRISQADALALYRANDLNALGIIASVVREQKNGNYATYIHNRYINYSNICILSCQFCAFAAKKRDAHAFEYAIDEIIQVVRDALPLGVTEVHMVGGLHPTLKKEWYLELLQRLRALDPKLHIKAFTAIEVRHLAQRIFRMPIRDTLETLRAVGLGSITGGGAEIFDPAVRDKICRGKETAAEWLDVHRTWHSMDGRSTCTMLYGHIETLPQRVDHLRQLRGLQDETGGFTGFVPFAFEPSQSHGILAQIKRASAFEQLRNLAVSEFWLVAVFLATFASDNRLNEPMSGNDRGNKGRSEDDADDVRLMRLIGRGETIALEELIEKHQALVAGTVARMLGSNSDVEDIAQQVFIRVWKSARRYVPRAKFTTWLLKITRNLVFNELRRAKRHAHVPLQPETGTEDPPLKDEAQSPPDVSLLEVELQRKIEEAILQLPEAQRMALVLRRYEQLSYDQIAEVLDLSVPAVKSVLFRARTELRSRLSKYLGGPA